MSSTHQAYDDEEPRYIGCYLHRHHKEERWKDIRRRVSPLHYQALINALTDYVVNNPDLPVPLVLPPNPQDETANSLLEEHIYYRRQTALWQANNAHPPFFSARPVMAAPSPPQNPQTSSTQASSPQTGSPQTSSPQASSSTSSTFVIDPALEGVLDSSYTGSPSGSEDLSYHTVPGLNPLSDTSDHNIDHYNLNGLDTTIEINQANLSFTMGSDTLDRLSLPGDNTLHNITSHLDNFVDPAIQQGNMLPVVPTLFTTSPMRTLASTEPPTSVLESPNVSDTKRFFIAAATSSTQMVFGSTVATNPATTGAKANVSATAASVHNVNNSETPPSLAASGGEESTNTAPPSPGQGINMAPSTPAHPNAIIRLFDGNPAASVPSIITTLATPERHDPETAYDESVDMDYEYYDESETSFELPDASIYERHNSGLDDMFLEELSEDSIEVDESDTHVSPPMAPTTPPRTHGEYSPHNPSVGFSSTPPPPPSLPSSTSQPLAGSSFPVFHMGTYTPPSPPPPPRRRRMRQRSVEAMPMPPPPPPPINWAGTPVKPKKIDQSKDDPSPPKPMRREEAKRPLGDEDAEPSDRERKRRRHSPVSQPWPLSTQEATWFGDYDDYVVQAPPMGQAGSSRWAGALHPERYDEPALSPMEITLAGNNSMDDDEDVDMELDASPTPNGGATSLSPSRFERSSTTGLDNGPASPSPSRFQLPTTSGPDSPSRSNVTSRRLRRFPQVVIQLSSHVDEGFNPSSTSTPTRNGTTAPVPSSPLADSSPELVGPAGSDTEADDDDDDNGHTGDESSADESNHPPPVFTPWLRKPRVPLTPIPEETEPSSTPGTPDTSDPAQVVRRPARHEPPLRKELLSYRYEYMVATYGGAQATAAPAPSLAASEDGEPETMATNAAPGPGGSSAPSSESEANGESETLHVLDEMEMSLLKAMEEMFDRGDVPEDGIVPPMPPRSKLRFSSLPGDESVVPEPAPSPVTAPATPAGDAATATPTEAGSSLAPSPATVSAMPTDSSATATPLEADSSPAQPAQPTTPSQNLASDTRDSAGTTQDTGRYTSEEIIEQVAANLKAKAEKKKAKAEKEKAKRARRLALMPGRELVEAYARTSGGADMWEEIERRMHNGILDLDDTTPTQAGSSAPQPTTPIDQATVPLRSTPVAATPEVPLSSTALATTPEITMTSAIPVPLAQATVPPSSTPVAATPEVTATSSIPAPLEQATVPPALTPVASSEVTSTSSARATVPNPSHPVATPQAPPSSPAGRAPPADTPAATDAPVRRSTRTRSGGAVPPPPPPVARGRKRTAATQSTEASEEPKVKRSRPAASQQAAALVAAGPVPQGGLVQTGPAAAAVQPTPAPAAPPAPAVLHNNAPAPPVPMELHHPAPIRAAQPAPTRPARSHLPSARAREAAEVDAILNQVAPALSQFTGSPSSAPDRPPNPGPGTRSRTRQSSVVPVGAPYPPAANSTEQNLLPPSIGPQRRRSPRLASAAPVAAPSNVGRATRRSSRQASAAPSAAPATAPGAGAPSLQNGAASGSEQEAPPVATGTSPDGSATDIPVASSSTPPRGTSSAANGPVANGAITNGTAINGAATDAAITNPPTNSNATRPRRTPSTTRPAKKKKARLVPAPTTALAPEPELAPQTMPEATVEPAPAEPQSAPESVPESVSEAAPATALRPAPEPTPQVAPGPAPEATAEPAPEPVARSAARAKKAKRAALQVGSPRVTRSRSAPGRLP